MNNNAPAERYPCDKTRLLAEHSKEDFIRANWIKLANEDAPLELFDENFGEVVENEHQIVLDKLTATISYSASVGYDRQEPYIDYETYYEDEPYLTTETYYDTNYKENRTRQVTKYKRVARQRQVTRYKTVTDWSAINGTHADKSFVMVENAPGQTFYENLFEVSIRTVDERSYCGLTEEEHARYQISKETYDEAMSEHKDNLYNSLLYALPGDHNRNVDATYSIDSQISSMCVTNDYTAEIIFGGKRYKRYAYPFGCMSIGGDSITNPTSLKDAISKLEHGLKQRTTERKEAVNDYVWERTKVLSIGSIAMLGVSILTSAFIRILPLVIIAFALSVAGFIATKIVLKNVTEEEEKKAFKDIENDTAKTKNEIANFSKIHNQKLVEALNKKLKELGLAPATNEEIEKLLN